MAGVDAQPFLVALALGGDRDALDVGRRAIGKIHVHQHVARDALGQHLADQGGTVRDRGLPMRSLPVGGAIGLRQRERGYSQNGAFERARDRPRIGHVLGGVLAPVDAGQDQIRPLAVEDVAHPHDDAVGRRSLDGVTALVERAHAQRIVERERMRHAGLVEFRRHHPDIVGQRARDLGAGVEAGRVDAVVIGNQDTHARLHVVRSIALTPPI